ncbi:hypothetical protein KO465_01870 [Candidatus Micrarchaeota archaeon]|nr:hypothetical protein [Candidatus Micrarchaeota archaeon]
MDFEWLAKHPYTDEAKNTIKEINPQFSDELLHKAQEKLIYLLMREPSTIKYISDIQAREDLILYPVIRLITSQMNYSFSNRISRTFSKLWVSTLKQESDVEKAIQLLNLKIKDNKMAVADYLADLPYDHKLVNKPVQQGVVYLSEQDIWDVIQKHLERTFIETLPKIKNDKAKKAAETVMASIPMKSEFKVSKITDMAPCMQEIIDKLNKGENVPHMARWTIAVYLNKAGWSEDALISLFSRTPNFEPKLTTYHINYMIEKNYSVPSCESLKSQGICVADCRIKSPVSYRGKKK